MGNAGTLNCNSETIVADSTLYNSSIINGGSGTITVVYNTTNTGTFTCGTGTINLQRTLSNSGTFICGADSVTVAKGATNSGTFTGGTGTDTFGAKCTNTGTINGPVGASSIMYFTGGYVGNTGSAFICNSGFVDFSVSYTLNAGSFTEGSGEVLFHGSYTNYGTFTAGTGLTYFGKEGTQKLYDYSTGGSVFNNVLFYCKATLTTGSGGFFAVSPTGVLTMYDDGSYASTLTAGDNSATPTTADAYLTLQSNATSSATVAPITGNTSIKGNVNVQRYVTGGAGYRGYRLLSSPVYVYGTSDYSLNYPINNAYLKGSTGTAGGFDAAGNPNLYLYRENLTPSNASFTSGNWRGVNKINNATAYNYSFDSESSNYYIHPGQGFLFFFRGSRKAAALATESVTSYTPTADTLTATGVLNQGAVNTQYWYSGTTSMGYTVVTSPSPGNSTVIGFNCVGNPYASTIDLNTASTTAGSGITISSQVETNFYELDPITQNYDVWDESLNMGTNNASRYIASGQGFFIKVDAAGQTITFNEAAKNTSAQNVAPNLFLAKRVDIASPGASSTPSEVAGGSALLGASAAPAVRNLSLKQAALPAAHHIGPPVNNNSHLRLQLALDDVNKDDMLLVFNPAAKSNYSVNEDAKYQRGNGVIGLASISADGVDLAINQLPLAGSKPTVVPIRVMANSSGTFTVNLTELNAVPELYDIWLMDAYKKDSLDIKHNPSYIFDVNISDTNTFHSKRLSLVIRQDPGLMVHLLKFTAARSAASNLVTWITENEANYTNFTVQRSTNGGSSFTDMDSLTSNFSGTYNWFDRTPAAGANIYRLKMTDLNRAVTYSNMATIMYANTQNTISTNGLAVYPNPATGVVNLAIAQAATAQPQAGKSYRIQVTNNVGATVRSAVSANPTWQSDVSSLSPGTYFISVVDAASNSVVGKTAFVKL
jgi:hypothetical protein